MNRATAMTHWMTTATEVEVHDFSHVGAERCQVCGRVLAAPDCEPDVTLCWWSVNGSDPRCELLRTPADPCCVVCWQPVDPETAHTVHEECAKLGPDDTCTCDGLAHPEHCTSCNENVEHLLRVEAGARALLAGYDQFAAEVPEDHRAALLDKFRAIEAQMGLVRGMNISTQPVERIDIDSTPPQVRHVVCCRSTDRTFCGSRSMCDYHPNGLCPKQLPDCSVCREIDDDDAPCPICGDWCGDD